MDLKRQNSLLKHFAQCWTAYTTVILCLCATLWVSHWANLEVQNHQQALFNQSVLKFQHTLELYFASQSRILQGIGAYFSATTVPSNAQFKHFLDAQGIRANHPGMFDLGFIAYVRPEDRHAWTEFARAHETVPIQAAWMPNDDNSHLVLTHWDNFKEGYGSPFGSYIFTEEDRLQAMRSACDKAVVVCSDKLKVQTGNGVGVPGGFILYSPVFIEGKPTRTYEERQAALRGYAFASFLVADVAAAVEQAAQEPHIQFSIYEGRAAVPNKLWHTLNPRPAMARAPQFTNQELRPHLGRDWTLQCASLPAYENSPEMRIPGLILLAGGAFSLVLFLLILSQNQARVRTESLAGKLENLSHTLAEEKELMEVTLSSLQEGVITVDSTGKVVLLNHAAQDKTGQTLAVAQGKRWEQVFLIEEAPGQARFPIHLQETLKNGVSWQTPHPLNLRTINGANLPILASISPMRGDQSTVNGAVIIFYDVTEKQKLLEEQIRSGKLESIGLLAGGIAHDFNNLLTAIMGNISLGAVSEDAADRAQCLKEAESACSRARELTQQLLTFAKGGAPIRKTAVLADTIRESARFASHGSAVRCVCTFPGNMWPVDADQGQIGQVIHNLVINAVQAMPQGGSIDITAENRVLEAGNCQNLPAANYVKISIQDQGVGISSEHLSKIFDPYFTTKTKGSGLGLATCYSIIKRHEGCITVESTQDKGTRFDIYLPASHQVPNTVSEPIAQTAPAALSAQVCPGRILVMDDEQPVLMLLEKMLKKLGHDTLCAREGAEAVRLFAAAKARGEPIAAAILDLTVPGGVGGQMALKKLRDIDPNLKAIVSSGYSSDWVMSSFKDHGFQAVVSKPYNLETLAAALRQVIQGEANADSNLNSEASEEASELVATASNGNA